MSKRIKIVAITGIAALLIAVSAIPAFAGWAQTDMTAFAEPTNFFTPLDTVAILATSQSEPNFEIFYDVDTTFVKDSTDNLEYANKMTYTVNNGANIGTQTIRYAVNSSNMYTIIFENDNFDIPEGHLNYQFKSLENAPVYLRTDTTSIEDFFPSVTTVQYTIPFSTSATYKATFNVIEIAETVNNVGATTSIQKRLTSKTFQSTTREGLLRQYRDNIVDYNVDGVYYNTDIVGISDIEISLSLYADNYNITTTSFDGEVFYRGMAEGTYSNIQTLLNTNVGMVLGTTTTVTETVYNDKMDIASVFSSIADALSVDILGPISPMDILTIVIGLSLTIWVLKLIAGG